MAIAARPPKTIRPPIPRLPLGICGARPAPPLLIISLKLNNVNSQFIIEQVLIHWITRHGEGEKTTTEEKTVCFCWMVRRTEIDDGEEKVANVTGTHNAELKIL